MRLKNQFSEISKLINLYRFVNSLEPSKEEKETKFWNFSEINDDEAELSLYGELVAEKSWWDESGNVTANEFKKELDKYSDKDKIILRINSPGGDVFTAVAIYTLLRDCNAEIVAKIDGMCMSAATIVAMGANKIIISSAGVFMAHDPLIGLYGYYNAAELTKLINKLEVVKESIMNTYVIRTGKTKEELKELMTNELWLTGEEAVEEGFCDEVMFKENEDSPIVDNNNMLVINSVRVNLDNYNIPKKFKNKLLRSKSKKDLGIDNMIPRNASFFNSNFNNKGDVEDVISTVEELKNKYPNIYDEVVKNAKDEERKRIQNIDELGATGFEELINSAKYKEIKDAGQCAMDIIKAQKNAGNSFLENREDDVSNSGVNNVPGTPCENTLDGASYNDKEAEDLFNKILGGIK